LFAIALQHLRSWLLRSFVLTKDFFARTFVAMDESDILTVLRAYPGGASPAELARHLGIAPSTLSAALARLERHGLLRLDADPADARRRRIRLTDAGRDAVIRDSVLDARRVAAMLELLADDERKAAVHGLRLLAAAARRLQEGGS
jgi:DNA-binding MarR family transcriptional regulator